MNSRLATLAAAAALFCAGPAWAQGYGGIGVGPSRISIDCTGTTSCDRSDTGFKIYGGWNLASPFAIEGAYIDWGRAHSSTTGSTSETEGPADSSLSTRVRGIALAGAYVAKFGWGQCAAKLGLAWNRARTTVSTGGVGSTSTHNYTAPYVGADCAYPVSSSLWVAAGVDFSRAKYTASDKADLTLLWIGLRF